MIPIPLISALVACAIGAAGAWNFQANKYERELSELRSEYATAQAIALEKAHADSQKYQADKDLAERLAAVRQSALARDLAAVRHERDGLRDELTTSRVQLPDASCTSVKRFADTASIVIGECSARLVEVAEQADRAFGEVMFLQDAWPSNVDSD